MRRRGVFLLTLGALCGLGPWPATLPRLQAEAGANVDFVKEVRPILEAHCHECHGSETREAGLRLDRRDAALAGGDSGAVIVPGEPQESLLLELVRGDDPDRVMPPKDETLSAAQIKTLERWIAEGAVWPEGVDPPEQPSGHWSYQPLRRTQSPQPVRAHLVRNPIDAFVQSRLAVEGFGPAAEADRVTLIKRLYYDLLGLPPTPEEVDAFVADARGDAYETLVERLLASPHFGERWGRHWLDKARYADSDGYEKDRPRDHAWKYRDWVIDAVNSDMPFDQFTIEQLAGDLEPDPSPGQLLATGFNRQTLTNTEGGVDPEEFRVEAVFDRVETLGAVWLGLTVGCARCHSHKYDQISQREYYQLFAFFNNAEETTLEYVSSEDAMDRYAREHSRWQARLEELEAPLAARRDALRPAFTEWLATATEPSGETAPDAGTAPASPAALPKAVRDALAVAADRRTEKQQETIFLHFALQDPDYKPLHAAVEKHRQGEPFRPAFPVAILREREADRRGTRIFRRGSFLEPLGPVSAATLDVLPRPEAAGRELTRLDLARWVVSPENPLTPRVVVNQVWAHLFGAGLVKTVGDFGVRGEPPSHPELLDWLASELLRHGWSRKRLVRTIVLSHTYRQSSVHRPELATVDPENRLLARQNRLRVEGEIVRDLYLASSGLLERRLGGPSVFPPLPEGIAELSYANNFKWGASAWNSRPDNPHGVPPREDVHRRGMYTFFKRTAAHPCLTTFDCPDANLTCLARQTSNTPLQALQTLNEPTFVAASRALALRAIEGSPDDGERIRRMVRLCLARPPETAEESALASLLADARHGYAGDAQGAALVAGESLPENVTAAEAAAWVTVARVVLNLDEFLTRE
jgi:cytochrome c553